MLLGSVAVEMFTRYNSLMSWFLVCRFWLVLVYCLLECAMGWFINSVAMVAHGAI